ncbi:Inner membrane protein YohC [Burkholderiaceae bacterium]|nr:Inner membrane protein YohC [Burkholderiaceae bacterium]
MNLVQRVKDILLTPKTTWPQIDQEPADVKSLYTSYIVFLAAIPAIASFIGLSLFGIGAFGVNYRVPVMSGLTRMIVGYVLSLGIVFVLALVVDALAPTFGGRKNQVSALKLVAYGTTASFVGGIFGLLPSLSILGIVAAVYSIYLIYLGLPVVMKCPPEKAGGYTAAVVVCGVVAGVLLATISAAVMPTHGPMGSMGSMGSADGDITISTPGGKVSIDTARMEEMARKMEEAGKRVEAAQKSGDSEAAGKAMGEMLGALGGGAAIPAQDLKALLPATLAGMPRESFEVQSGQAMGLGGSGARATYAADGRRVDFKITDMGGMGAFAAVAGFAQVSSESENDTKTEKTYKRGNRTVHEEAHKDGSRAEVTVFLGNGVMVEASGEHMDLQALHKALDEANLGKIESIKRADKS